MSRRKYYQEQKELKEGDNPQIAFRSFRPKPCPRCRAQTTDRTRCKRPTCQTFPYCWQHMKKLRKLRVGRSDLLHSKGLDGLGLFAVGEGFKRGEKIGYYTGFPPVPNHLCSKYKFYGSRNVRQQIPRRGCYDVSDPANPVVVDDNKCIYTQARTADARCYRTTSCVPSSMWTMGLTRGRCAEARHLSTDVVRYINDCRAADKRAGHCAGTNAEYRSVPGRGLNVVLVRAKKRIAPGEEIYMSYSRSYWRDVARAMAEAGN